MNQAQTLPLDSAESNDYHPSEVAVETAISENLVRSLPFAAVSLGGLYLLLTIAHGLMLQPEHKPILVPVAAVTSLIFFAIYGFSKMNGLSADYAHVLCGLFGMLALVNSLLHIGITNDPLQTSNILIVLVAIGAFFLSQMWFTITILSAWIGWGTVVLLAEPAETWVHFGIGMAMATIAAIVVNRIRLRAYNNLFSLRLREAHQREELNLIRHKLEERVDARTSQLNKSYSKLQEEVNRRRSTQDALRESEQSLIAQRNSLQKQVDRQTVELRKANESMKNTDRLKMKMLDDIRFELSPQIFMLRAQISQLESNLGVGLSTKHAKIFDSIGNISEQIEGSLNNMRDVSHMRADGTKRPQAMAAD